VTGRGGEWDNTARVTISGGECGQPRIALGSVQLRMNAWMPPKRFDLVITVLASVRQLDNTAWSSDQNADGRNGAGC
jgi:hypothetical protein